MMATELMACHVPQDPAFPEPTKGYMVSSMVFYEQGFGILAHRFLRSLLQYYTLELHNLTPSREMHIATFMTLCEAYHGVEPEFGMWNYFFCVVIHVKSRHGVDPYLDIPRPRLMKGWQKKWFYFDIPTFTGSCPIALPSWGDGVTKRDLNKLQPMHDALQELRWEGLTGGIFREGEKKLGVPSDGW
jgi:hypothetical protein